MIYGYCRISKPSQNIARQIRNIKEKYPEAIIVEEAYTGRSIKGRTKFEGLLQTVVSGDLIVFDSVSRMSRSQEEGENLYFDLYNQNIDMEFLKEPYINTEVFKEAYSKSIPCTGNEIADVYIEATNKVIRLLAKEMISKAFEQSQKEVDDLSNRTKEGLVTAKILGKQIGGVKGRKLTTKKSIESKRQIKKLSRDFDGELADIDVINRIGIRRATYYKYKKELREGM